MSESGRESCGEQDDSCIVKLRGLPWSATTDDILKFFRNSKVMNGKSGVHMTSSREGRPSGEAFVVFESDEDLKVALNKDREHIGSRYIEVFKVNKAEMDWVVKRSGPTYGFSDDGCVRLRGLPFGCSKEEIAQFFTGLEIVPNGITLLTDYSGRSSGEAFVQFANKEVAEKSLLKHREKIGHRVHGDFSYNLKSKYKCTEIDKQDKYIEIFRSSLSEVNTYLGYNNRRGGGGPNSGMYNNRPSPYDRGDRFGGGGNSNNRFQSRGSRNFKGADFSNSSSDYGSYDRWSGSHNGDSRGGRSPYEIDSWGDSNNSGGGRGSGLHCVHMRGLPFKASQGDIADFFKPLVPVNVRLLQDHTGRASGEADVEFASHDDAMRAMNKDKGHMQHRYIELFLNSAGDAGFSGSGGRRRL